MTHSQSLIQYSTVSQWTSASRYHDDLVDLYTVLYYFVILYMYVLSDQPFFFLAPFFKSTHRERVTGQNGRMPKLKPDFEQMPPPFEYLIVGPRNRSNSVGRDQIVLTTNKQVL